MQYRVYTSVHHRTYTQAHIKKKFRDISWCNCKPYDGNVTKGLCKKNHKSFGKTLNLHRAGAGN